MCLLPDSLRREGQVLLHQQCWNWGYDVRRPEGNILIEYGFTRVRPPGTVQGSSQYTWNGPLTVRLWGFGFFAGRTLDRGIHVNRYEFLPRLAKMDQDVWEPAVLQSQCPHARGRACLGLLATALRWMRDYEAWVLRQCGVQYRRRALAQWNKPCILPEAMPVLWDRLAHALQDTGPAGPRGKLRQFSPPPMLP
jgi:hypothetical protein